jgi:repressor LexA
MRMTLTQQQVLQFIVSQWETGEALPSCREIMKRFGWASPKAATDVLKALKRLNFLARDPASSRNYRLTEQALGLPVHGEIPAGLPTGTTQTEGEYFNLSPSSFGIRDRANSFFLRVKGDSMIGRKIFDGDLVLIEKSETPQHLDIVAALIDQESTLKTLVRQGPAAWLRSENPAYPDLTPCQELQIQGIARGVIRPLHQ